ESSHYQQSNAHLACPPFFLNGSLSAASLTCVPSADMRTRQIRVKGRVQGVGFRDALRAEALRLRVSGWVRNRADGSVEALLQGDDAAVARLGAWGRLRHGVA